MAQCLPQGFGFPRHGVGIGRLVGEFGLERGDTFGLTCQIGLEVLEGRLGGDHLPFQDLDGRGSHFQFMMQRIHFMLAAAKAGGNFRELLALFGGGEAPEQPAHGQPDDSGDYQTSENLSYQAHGSALLLDTEFNPPIPLQACASSISRERTG